MRLSTQLGITHGVFVASLLILLVVTLQGLVRMLGLITDIRDDHLSTVAAEEQLHRSAWAIEVGVRHGRGACGAGAPEQEVRASVERAREALHRVLGSNRVEDSRPLLAAARRYISLADGVIAGDVCANLRSPRTDALRAALDEEMTDAWIARMHQLHGDIRAREDAARRIGVRTALTGLGFAALAALAAMVIVRSTARSVAEPIASLAKAATRVGEGDFAPIPDAHGPAEVRALWSDLDRMRERLMELERMKQAFLANVSHELRSPLTRLREALGLLADGTAGPLTAQQERVVSLGMRACEREVRIVEALLDMSRLRSGLPVMREGGGNIDRVVASAAQDERTEADERGVVVEVVSEGAAPTLDMDSALVERAVANLLRNAVSVSTAGAVVRVERTLVDGPRRKVAIEVSDHGPGIADDVRANLFRPFSASAVATIDRPAGIGLGLAFAREVARLHGGDLTVAASDASGTTFRIELPVDPERSA